MAQTANKEKSEAERIYQAIFRASVPSSIEKRYYRACEVLFSGNSRKERLEYEEALKKVSDLEALELAARHRHRIPLLVSRFRLMVHLAETLPRNQRFFVHTGDGRGRSFLSLSAGGVRTVFKFIKGWFLLERMGNV